MPPWPAPVPVLGHHLTGPARRADASRPPPARPCSPSSWSSCRRWPSAAACRRGGPSTAKQTASTSTSPVSLAALRPAWPCLPLPPSAARPPAACCGPGVSAPRGCRPSRLLAGPLRPPIRLPARLLLQATRRHGATWRGLPRSRPRPRRSGSLSWRRHRPRRSRRQAQSSHPRQQRHLPLPMAGTWRQRRQRCVRCCSRPAAWRCAAARPCWGRQACGSQSSESWRRATACAHAALEDATQEEVERWLRRSTRPGESLAAPLQAVLAAQQRALSAPRPQPLPRLHGGPPPDNVGAAVRHMLLRRQYADQAVRRVLAEVAEELVAERARRAQRGRQGRGRSSSSSRSRSRSRARVRHGHGRSRGGSSSPSRSRSRSHSKDRGRRRGDGHGRHRM